MPTPEAFISVDNEVVRKLHNGDMTIGWRGDPNMEIAYNKKLDILELWRNGEDGQWKLLAQSNPGVRVLDTNFLLYVRDHDPYRGYDAFASIEKANQKIREENEKKQDEAIKETAERVAYELRKKL
jgi:hypothetical protein